MIIWTPPATNAEQAAREIVDISNWMHLTFKDEFWLWRGQSLKTYRLDPGMHTRVLNAHGVKNADQAVIDSTGNLIKLARNARLDIHENTCLPDLALLAHLQHYGAATPLLDVTNDPLIALWMIAFADPQNPSAHDKKSGLLYGIKKPPDSRHIRPLDARPFAADDGPSIAASLGGKVWWYEAPDVTERLRIQRGSFLIGPMVNRQRDSASSLPLMLDHERQDWLKKRIDNRGKSSNTTHSWTEVFAILVRGSVKPYLRNLLVDRCGLSVSSVYPTPWHRPFIQEFSSTYGRTRDLDMDIGVAGASPVKMTSDSSAAT